MSCDHTQSSSCVPNNNNQQPTTKTFWLKSPLRINSILCLSGVVRLVLACPTMSVEPFPCVLLTCNPNSDFVYSIRMVRALGSLKLWSNHNRCLRVRTLRNSLPRFWASSPRLSSCLTRPRRDHGQHFSRYFYSIFGFLFGVEAPRFRVAKSSRRFVDIHMLSQSTRPHNHTTHNTQHTTHTAHHTQHNTHNTSVEAKTLHMADSIPNPGSPLEANRVRCDPGVPCCNVPNCRWRSVGTCRFMHSVSEPEAMQERRGDGTEAKLCNLINQLEELSLMIQEGTKVIRSQSPQSENMLDTRDTVLPNELAKPIQAEAEVHQASSEGRNEYDRPGNESETVETTRCEQGSGRSQRNRRLQRPHRAVSMQWRDMAWAWLEPDEAALRLRRLFRQGRVLLAEWRGVRQSLPKSTSNATDMARNRL